MVSTKASYCEEQMYSSFAVCIPFCGMWELHVHVAVTLNFLIPCEPMRLEIDHTKPCILLN